MGPACWRLERVRRQLKTEGRVPVQYSRARVGRGEWHVADQWGLGLGPTMKMNQDTRENRDVLTYFYGFYRLCKLYENGRTAGPDEGIFIRTRSNCNHPISDLVFDFVTLCVVCLIERFVNCQCHHNQ